MLHHISQYHAPIAQLFALRQFQIDLFLHFVKQRNSGTQEHWMNIEPDLVDQIRVKKCFSQNSAAHLADSFAFCGFESANEVHRIFGNDLDSLVRTLLDRTGEDIIS